MSQMRKITSLVAVAFCTLLALTACEDSSTNPSAQSNTLQEKLMQPGPLPDNIIGNKDAKITIIEYASMTCSHCADFHKETFPALKQKYIDTGKAKFILREYPWDPLATAAFMIARCSGPDKYFPVVSALFNQLDSWAQEDPLPKLQAISRQLGFTEESFKTCLEDKDLMSKIQKIKDYGQKELNVTSTPTFFINGVRLGKSHNIEDFDKLIAEQSK